MKKSILLSAVLLLSCTQIFAQTDNLSFFSRNNISFTSPGAMGYSLYGYDNPAFLSAYRGNDLTLFGAAPVKDAGFSRWGFVSASPNFSFYFNEEKKNDRKINDYGLNFSVGDERFGIGAGYGWSNGEKSFFGRQNFWQTGAFYRPLRQISLSALGVYPENSDLNEWVFSLAIRPTGNELVSGFFDYIVQKEDNPLKNRWAAGVAVEPVPGLRAVFRYFENKSMTVGLQVGLGNISIFSQSHLAEGSGVGYQTYGIRFGSYDRNLIDITKKNMVAYSNMFGGLKYQKYKLFDGSNTLLNALQDIENVKDNPAYKGIILNMSGANINKEMLWELRERLKDLKNQGKKVLIYLDGGGFDLYHFASVADKIVIDPVSLISLPGYSISKTYMKGTLDKLGIGVDEWRFFKYKSAYETVARDKASDADKEQRQALIDDFYELAKQDIITSRPVLASSFDDIVNKKVLIDSEGAVAAGLVDTIARYDDLPKIFESMIQSGISVTNISAAGNNKIYDDRYWGKKSKIAIIYALGACAMDEGINARSLINDVRAAAANRDVKAIVLRVDSPGGDGKASDYIAEGLKKYASHKPVIVSQGSVAASGGYWLSMYADTIIAAPNTITGSIGVIGGWYYNKGFSDLTGLTSDQVQKGERADLFSGVTVPLLGITIPSRNLTAEEKEKVKEYFMSNYEMFKKKVATGRKMSVDEVEKLAQGRVWSGIDGSKNGLVDVLGGLDDAIRIAASKAGLDEYEIVEYPNQPWFDLGKLLGLPSIPSFESSEMIKDLKFRLKNNGVPLFLIPDEFREITEP
ncbi:MAG: S49 family peptidase [Bacteroidetes bacterium]|nr:S49 family peptidase [Bacteroidota bacterium]